VKLKDLAIAKRAQCKQKLVCVPDSILKRGCNADVFSLGMLMLQLVLGLDLFRATEQDFKRVDAHTREVTAGFIEALQLIFSGTCTFDQVANHPYFSVEDEVPYGQQTPGLVSVEVVYDVDGPKTFLSPTKINLAGFEAAVKVPYAAEIRKLVERNENGKSGIRILDDSLVAFIEQG